MKTLLKTVSLTLVISVTMLFFSSYKKVEAAGAVSGASVPFVSLPAAEQDVFYEALERFAKEIMGYDTSPEISYTMPDGTVITGTKTEIINEIKRRADQEYIRALQDSNDTTLYYIFSNPGELSISSVLTDEFCSTTHKSSNNGVHGGAGKLRVGSSSYNAAVNDFISNSVKTVSGAAAGITMGITTVNGKPQKVTTTYAKSTIEVFDYLNLEYNVLNSITDILLYYDMKGNVDSNMNLNDYYLPFVIKDKKIYVPSINETVGLVYFSSSRYGRFFNYTTTGYGIQSIGGNYQAFRFANIDGQICISFFDCNRSDGSNPSSYPVLFDTPGYYITGDIQTNFENRNMSFPLVFLNPLDFTDVISHEDILSNSFDTCGYFVSSSQVTYNYTGTLGTACKMLGGTENAVQGGTNTTYSELSDIEKAIYALAKQQGITYEEMLE